MPIAPDVSHVPTKATRQMVKEFARVQTKQDIIADIIGIDPKTLRKHYREELDQEHYKAIKAIGGALYNKAMSGDTAAMIFWLKTQACWKETSKIEGDLSLKVVTGVPATE
jgi:hypothetical protein